MQALSVGFHDQWLPQSQQLDLKSLFRSDCYTTNPLTSHPVLSCLKICTLLLDPCYNQLMNKPTLEGERKDIPKAQFPWWPTEEARNNVRHNSSIV